MRFHENSDPYKRIRKPSEINTYPREDSRPIFEEGRPLAFPPVTLPQRPEALLLQVRPDRSKTNTTADIGTLFRSDVDEIAEGMSRQPNTGAKTQPSFLFGNTKPKVTGVDVQDHTGEVSGSSEVVRLSLEGVKSTAPAASIDFTVLGLLLSTGRPASQAERQARDWIEYFKSRPTGEVPADRLVESISIDPELFALQSLQRQFNPNEKITKPSGPSYWS